MVSQLHPFAQSAPRIIVPNNGFMGPCSPSSSWFHSPKQAASSSSSLSYAAVVNGNGGNTSPNPFASPSNPSFVSPFYQNGDDEVLFGDDGKKMDFSEQIVSPGGQSDSMLFPFGNCSENHPQFLHRRCVYVNDVFLGQSDENSNNALGGGYGWKPCMYHAKWFCKNGAGCRLDMSSSVVIYSSLYGKLNTDTVQNGQRTHFIIAYSNNICCILIFWQGFQLRCINFGSHDKASCRLLTYDDRCRDLSC